MPMSVLVRWNVARIKNKVNGRPAFLTIKDEVKQDLQNGVYASLIYAKHKERLPFGYRQFLHYIVEYRLRDGSSDIVSQPPASARSQSNQETGTAPSRQPKSAAPRTLPVFEYDPMDAYRKSK